MLSSKRAKRAGGGLDSDTRRRRDDPGMNSQVNSPACSFFSPVKLNSEDRFCIFFNVWGENIVKTSFRHGRGQRQVRKLRAL